MNKVTKVMVLILLLLGTVLMSKPVNVSASSAVTWDPNNKGASVDLYNNMTVGGKGGYGQNVTATGSGYSSGKYYWEITVTSADCATSGNDGSTGVKNASSSIADGITVNIGYISVYDKIYGNHTIDTNSTIGYLLDLDNHVLKILTDKGINASTFALTAGVTYKPAVALTGTTIRITANFGVTPFKYSLPAGYLPYDNTGLAAPSNLEVTGADKNIGVELRWGATANATSYNIKRSETAGGPYINIVPAVTSVSGSKILFTDNTVESGKTYYYVVSAVINGAESTNSNEVSATIPAEVIGIPTNLTATVGDGQVILTWGAVDGATSYNIKRSETAGGPYINIEPAVTSVSGSNILFTDNTAETGKTYYYVVSAVINGAESTNSNEVSATIPVEVIDIPANLTATAGDKQVILTWSAVDGATSYNIKYSATAGGPYTTIATDSAATFFTHTGLTNDATYYYVVSAITPSGESADSIEVPATPHGEVILGNAILDIYLDNGSVKEYNLTGAEVADFLTWYDNRSLGADKAYFVFSVKGPTAPYTSIRNYIPYVKILYFDIKEYNE